MINALKKITALLLLAAIAVCVASCSKSEDIPQDETHDASQTVSETVTQETEESETRGTTAEITTPVTTTTTSTMAATTTTATTTTTTDTTTTTTTAAATTTTPPPPVTTTTTATTTTTTKTTTTTTAPPPPVTTTTPAPEPQPSAKFAEQVFELVNQIRAEYGLPAYGKLDALTGAAQKRAVEISSFYSHTRPNSQPSYTVIKEYGMSYSFTGENIAAGQLTAQQVVNDWMGSTTGHREAILSPDYRYMGVGYTSLHGIDPQGFSYYWVQEFYTPL